MIQLCLAISKHCQHSKHLSRHFTAINEETLRSWMSQNQIEGTRNKSIAKKGRYQSVVERNPSKLKKHIQKSRKYLGQKSTLSIMKDVHKKFNKRKLGRQLLIQQTRSMNSRKCWVAETKATQICKPSSHVKSSTTLRIESE